MFCFIVYGMVMERYVKIMSVFIRHHNLQSCHYGDPSVTDFPPVLPETLSTDIGQRKGSTFDVPTKDGHLE